MIAENSPPDRSEIDFGRQKIQNFLDQLNNLEQNYMCIEVKLIIFTK